jgi:DNA-binding transcriptional MerR regulator
VSFTIYFDEDSQDADLIRILRARGLTVSSVNEQGMQRRHDDEQLALAAEKGWVLFTFNVSDFCRINSEWLQAGRSHARIIIGFQQRFQLGELAGRIVHIERALSAEEMKNRLEFLSNW